VRNLHSRRLWTTVAATTAGAVMALSFSVAPATATPVADGNQIGSITAASAGGVRIAKRNVTHISPRSLLVVALFILDPARLTGGQTARNGVTDGKHS